MHDRVFLSASVFCESFCLKNKRIRAIISEAPCLEMRRGEKDRHEKNDYLFCGCL